MIFTPEILIYPTIPPELIHISPRNMNKKSWWDNSRKEASEISGDRCYSCGIHKSEQRYKKHLVGHEICTVHHDSFQLTLEQVVVLCNSCANFIHVGSLIRKFNEEVIGYGYLFNVLNHGVNVLKEDELKPTATQAIHWLIMCKNFNEVEAIEYVRLASLFKKQREIQDGIEWQLTPISV